jgi:hypothetical protein
MTAVTDRIYPQSTPEGQAVPLEIAKPSGLFYIEFAIGSTDITIPDSFDGLFGTFYASKDCVIQFGASLPSPLVSGTEYPNAVLIPAYTVFTITMVKGAASVQSLEAGTLYITALQPWQLLHQEYQTITG